MTIPLYDLQKVSRVHVVDNSKLALDGNVYKRMPRIIHCYKKNNNLTRTSIVRFLHYLLEVKSSIKTFLWYILLSRCIT